MSKDVRPQGMTMEEAFRWYLPKDPRGSRCVEWPHTVTGDGYGQFRIKGQPHYAHVASYTIHVGPVNGLCVLHDPEICNNRRCVNPDHLRLGTKADNNRDKRISGTQPQGEQVSTAKLTDSDVREIRRRYSAGGSSQRKLASLYGVSQTLIGLITRQKVWTHV